NSGILPTFPAGIRKSELAVDKRVLAPFAGTQKELWRGSKNRPQRLANTSFQQFRPMFNRGI
ncbi:MAG TPA: hypothetical protein PK201_06940, partial [Accumulibacter sp.]|nr:hypothetical protein [Accumulibacter sp.]